MVVVGVLTRINRNTRNETLEALSQLDGVTLFELPNPEPERIGLVLRARTLDSAHALLTEQIDTTEGVLGTWPVHTELDSSAESPVGDALLRHGEDNSQPTIHTEQAMPGPGDSDEQR